GIRRERRRRERLQVVAEDDARAGVLDLSDGRRVVDRHHLHPPDRRRAARAAIRAHAEAAPAADEELLTELHPRARPRVDGPKLARPEEAARNPVLRAAPMR